MTKLFHYEKGQPCRKQINKFNKFKKKTIYLTSINKNNNKLKL